MPQCFQYGGPHLKDACLHLARGRTCHGCGKEGHFIKDCPSDRNVVSGPTVQSQIRQRKGVERPQATDGVYAVTGAEATA